MYSFPNLQPVCSSMSSSNCCFLTCIQISQDAHKVVWYSHVFQNFPQFVVIHTVKGIGVVKSTSRFFLELSCYFNDPLDAGTLISDSSAFSKSSLNIWKFLLHILLEHGLENCMHYFAGMWDECNCVVAWTFFGTAFLWDWNENWPFLQHHLLGFEIAQREFHHLHLFLVMLPKAHLASHSKMSLHW